jgi:hypothetical protein
LDQRRRFTQLDITQLDITQLDAGQATTDPASSLEKLGFKR